MAASLSEHALADLFPRMTEGEFQALKADIAQNGLLEPIVLFEGRLLDGRHRYRACRELGLEPKTRELKGVPAVMQVMALNARRRHLTSSQLAAIAVEADEILEEHKKAAVKRKSSAGGDKKSPSARQSVTQKIGEPIRHDNEADAQTAKAFGTNRQYVTDVKKIRAADPKLHAQVKNGSKTAVQAKAELRKAERLKSLETKAAAAKLESDQPSWTLIHADVMDGLSSVLEHHSRPTLIFADPPYNIGVDYGGGKSDDRMPHGDYLHWFGTWLNSCFELLSPDGSLWVLINDEYAAEYNLALKRIGFTIRSWVIWYESFGVNCSRAFNRTHRHLFHAVKNSKRFTFNESAVSRPSDRQTKYKDKRAAEGGKILDDVWTDVPRLTGTCAERIPSFPTQLPVTLVRRVVECSSDPGDLVVDPFNGSGTTGVACLEANRKYVGIDKSEAFIELADKRLKAVRHAS